MLDTVEKIKDYLLKMQLIALEKSQEEGITEETKLMAITVKNTCCNIYCNITGEKFK